MLCPQIITSVPEIPLSQLCYAAWLLGDALCCDGDHVKTPVLQCIEYSCCAFEESQTDSSGSILVGYQVSAVTQDNKSDGQLVCDYWISTGVGEIHHSTQDYGVMTLVAIGLLYMYFCVL